MDMESRALSLLFQRPLEPVFTSRDNGRAAFDLPDSYYTSRYNSAKVELQSRYGDNVEMKIPLRDLPEKPDLEFATKIGRKDMFSLFQEKHLQIAGRLIKVFLDAPDPQGLVSVCAYTKDRINPFLFQYCFSVAIGHRDDTSHITVPPIVETFPANFVEPSVLKDARAEASLITSPGDRMRVNIPRNYTASDREEEQRLAYFREDIGVNMHHWHWHLVYPAFGPPEVVSKDRRGELFYYMHHQIIARYNVERFCNNLARIVPLDMREPIHEGYFPKILSTSNNRTYPCRFTGTRLQDLTREDNMVEVGDCERWRDRILAAIDQGFVVDTVGRQYPLDEVRGIDLLGNIIEASGLSVNRQFYGNLHNTGHDLIAYSHDPENRHLEQFGVMGDVTTAMRDPVFYRWHAFIDGLCNKHKVLLPPYNDSELSFKGITVDYVEATVCAKGAHPNTLLTYWQKSDVDLAAGLDFGPNGNIFASFTHLQNAPFEYTFKVSNNTGSLKRGTCRVFISPQVNEHGEPLKLEEQRLLAVELDKFTVDLNRGQNTIRRRSDESSVTIPFERSFRRIGANFTPREADQLARFRFCGCGWPQHMLLPKGKAEGMTFDLFVMISDYAGDAVQQTNNSPDVCGDAASFCGLKDKLYPDKRTMGYPFDRRLPGDNLDALVSSYSNMKTTDVVIIFNDRIVDKD